MSILKYKDPKTGEFKRINPYKADLSFVGKDGIVVNRAANSEEVEISGEGLVQKLTPGGATLVYAKYSNGRDGSIVVNENYTGAQTLPSRNLNGELIAETSDKAVDKTLTNKKYVADNYVEKLKFTNLEQALNGYILDTTKEAYADLNSAVLKNSVAVGDNVYPIADKTRALVTRIEGKTTKMVQLLDKSTFPATSTPTAGITVTKTDDGGLHVLGTAANSGGRNSWGITVNIEKGHKYLSLLKGNNKITTPFVTLKSDTSQYVSFVADIVTSTIEGECYYGFNLAAEDYDETIYPQLFDLTAMNREDITTVEQFKAEFPEFYPYENGNIYPAKISGVKFYEKQDKSGEQGSVTLPETYDLHGIGDYKDYLEITKNENNELYTLKKVQVIDKHVFDGTETWAVYNRVNFENVAFRTTLLADKYTGWYSRGNLMNLLVNIKTLSADKKGYTHGDNSSNIYISLPNIATPADMKAHVLSMYEAGTPYIFYGTIETPVETIIATNLTYEQVTAIRHNGGLIEVEGNINKGYARPTITNTIVYRLTAANTAEV